jgi:hypothetical protein
MKNEIKNTCFVFFIGTYIFLLKQKNRAVKKIKCFQLNLK